MNKLRKTQIKINKQQAKLIRTQRRQLESQIEIDKRDAIVRQHLMAP